MHRMQAVWMQIVRMQAYCIHDVCVGEYIMCTHACMHVLVLCNWVDMVIRVGQCTLFAVRMVMFIQPATLYVINVYSVVCL